MTYQHLLHLVAWGWIGMLTLLSAESGAAQRFAGHATASSGQGAYNAQYAIDGDMTTRWGSAFSDNEWWQIAFEQPERIAGLHIVWEHAYGEKYAIQISDDGTQWQSVFVETAGDGRGDWIFFAPVTTKFVRLQGLQRGTGWGYSIWELRPLPASDWPLVQADDTQPGRNPQAIVDGKPETFWQSTAQTTTSVIIDLRHPIDLGGLEIVWGEDFATSYTIELATPAGQWRRVARVAQGNGKQDFVYFPSVRGRRIMLVLERSIHGQGYAIAEIKLKGGDEHATPLRFYHALAQERPRGWYPRWLSREQEFWTITGVPDDAEESLFGESGVFEPYAGGFTVMPFVQVGSRLLAWPDVEVEQALEAGYLPLPKVTWQAETWSLTIAPVSFGQAGASHTAVRYRLTNRGQQDLNARLILAIRPLQLNPQWQRGGFSALQWIEAVPDGAGQILRLNGQDKMIAPQAASQVVTLALEQGTVLDCVTHGGCPSHALATDKEGKCEAAFIYDVHLEPGAADDVVLIFPLHDKGVDRFVWLDAAAAFERHWQEQRHFWQTLLNRVSISIPEPQLVAMLKSNLAYILLNQDGPWIKPGPRNYNHSWIRDGAMTSLALLRLGITEPVRRFLAAYVPLVDDKGWVPWIVFADGKPVAYTADSREGHEYDSQGQFPFLVRHYVDFTDDTTLLPEAYAAVIRALRFGSQLRRQRMTEPYRTHPEQAAYYGILPESNSHEGYYPAQHSYWDDFWYLRGLKDGIALAERLGKDADATWMRAELLEARQALYASMRRVIARDHLDYLPGSVEKGDFDATSTAIAIMVANETASLPQPYATHTFEQYYENFLQRLGAAGATTFTPYEVRTAEAFVRLGKRQRALHMLRVFTHDAARPPAWHHLAEVVHERYRAPSYIGDMPHTWVGSSYISAVRSLFVYEDGARLILAAGIDPAWVKQGGVEVQHLPTSFGSVSYTVRYAAGRLRMDIWGNAAPPGGFVVWLPREWRTKMRRSPGETGVQTEATVPFSTLPATLELEERQAHD